LQPRGEAIEPAEQAQRGPVIFTLDEADEPASIEARNQNRVHSVAPVGHGPSRRARPIRESDRRIPGRDEAFRSGPTPQSVGRLTTATEPARGFADAGAAGEEQDEAALQRARPAIATAAHLDGREGEEVRLGTWPDSSMPCEAL